MHISKLHSFEDYIQHQSTNTENNELLHNLEQKLNNELMNHEELLIDGYSWTAQAPSQFILDFRYSNDKEINFRERLVCNQTHLNNRIRGCIHILESYFNAGTDDSIYITEQFTLLARWMEDKYNNLHLSEYLNDCSLLARISLYLRNYPRKINHQDLTKLTFANNQFDYIMSFDCLEHIPDYKSALKEIHRTLKNKATFMFSVPFNINSKEHLVRAVIEEGKVKHLVEPEYHGNPVSNSGCLSFYTFGWDILDELRKIGFKNAYILLYWSEKYAYLGGEQILICAEK